MSLWGDRAGSDQIGWHGSRRVVVAIVEVGLPIRLIGVGETAEDLQDFQAEAFVNALLPKDATAAEES